MKTLFRLNSRASALFASLLGAVTLLGGQPVLDTAAIEKVTGVKGSLSESEGVFKVTRPRTDVKVSVDHRSMDPFLGLTSWAAFAEGKEKAVMVMGDLVLFQDEVNPVMSAALAAGLEVTALHNHFFFDEPKVYFMHIGGEGPAEKLAAAVRKAWDTVDQIRAANPQPASGFGGQPIPAHSSITAKTIENILGTKSQSKDGMVKVTLGRKTQMPCGCEVGKEMGVNTWAAFAGSDDHAMVDGDFAVHEGELQSVLRSLRAADIDIVAIHHHMSGEKPKMLFLHYWGKGSTEHLAKGIKAALATQKL